MFTKNVIRSIVLLVGVLVLSSSIPADAKTLDTLDFVSHYIGGKPTESRIAFYNVLAWKGRYWTSFFMEPEAIT